MRTSFIIISLALVSFFSSGFNNPDLKLKIPGEYNLFKIDRSRNADIVMYDVNLDIRGQLNTSNPISIYWKKHTEEGQYESLTAIQRKFGYGIKFQDISENKAVFQIVAYSGLTFELRRSGDDYFRVYTITDGKEIELKSLYIHFEDDSFWFPSISKIELHGIDANKGEFIAETIIP